MDARTLRWSSARRLKRDTGPGGMRLYIIAANDQLRRQYELPVLTPGARSMGIFIKIVNAVISQSIGEPILLEREIIRCNFADSPIPYLSWKLIIA